MYVTTMGVFNKKLVLLKEDIEADYMSGSVNVDKIVFNFSGDEWDELTKTAVFATESGKTINVPLIDDYCVVPPEAYSEKGNVSIGVYGIAIENDQIVKLLPTNLVSKQIRGGCYIIGQCPSNLPTPTQWDVYLQEISKIASEAKASEEVCRQLMIDITAMKEELELLVQSASESEEVCTQAKEDIEIIQDVVETLEANTQRNADYVEVQVKRLEDLDITVESISNSEIEAILNR